jgi:hypothetical protein
MTVLDALLRACTPRNPRAFMDGANDACTGRHDSDETGQAGFHRSLAILVVAVPEEDSELPSPLITNYNAWQHDYPHSLF